LDVGLVEIVGRLSSSRRVSLQDVSRRFSDIRPSEGLGLGRSRCFAALAVDDLAQSTDLAPLAKLGTDYFESSLVREHRRSDA
jgi:hypothetical protein